MYTQPQCPSTETLEYISLVSDTTATVCLTCTKSGRMG